MERLRRIFNRETIAYLIFGIATTLVNYVCFWLCYNILFGCTASLAANAIAFVAAVIFAFVVNKVFVFESKSWRWNVLKKEIPSFVASRIASFGIEELGLWVSEDLLCLNKFILITVAGQSVDGVVAAKVILSVVVVIVNYIFCKWFVFKK